MAVFTTLDFDEINALIQPYGIGDLVSFSGVSAGLENTNYAITTSSNHMAEEYGHDRQGEYFLTIFEELPENDLPFHLGLLETLGNKGIPVSIPVRDYDGKSIQTIAGKPAVLCPSLQGHHPGDASVPQCEAMGDMLARIHEISDGVDYHKGGIRDVKWLQKTLAQVESGLSDDERQLCHQTMDDYLQVCKENNLPSTIIHGDLFRDNALFDGNNLTGVIDFFSAGRGFALYDIAVSANDWCVSGDHLDADKLQAFAQGYSAHRPFTDEEKAHWPLFVKLTAMRFWLSRIQAHQRILSHPHELNTFKSPEPFRRLFLRYVNASVLAI